MSVKIYAARAMTGRYCDDLWTETLDNKFAFRQYGIETHDPVIEEGLPKEHVLLPNRVDEDGLRVWKADKRAIAFDCHVFVDCTASRRSEGVFHELGLARYGYWKPIVRIYDYGATIPMIAKFEDDVIVHSIDEAAKIINERWGTKWKRFKWRLALYAKKRWKMAFFEFLFWFQ